MLRELPNVILTQIEYRSKAGLQIGRKTLCVNLVSVGLFPTTRRRMVRVVTCLRPRLGEMTRGRSV